MRVEARITSRVLLAESLYSMQVEGPIYPVRLSGGGRDVRYRRIVTKGCLSGEPTKEKRSLAVGMAISNQKNPCNRDRRRIVDGDTEDDDGESVVDKSAMAVRSSA